MSKSYDDTATPTFLHAASALHGASNALNIARAYIPAEQVPSVIDVVQQQINEALDMIASEIGEISMLTA